MMFSKNYNKKHVYVFIILISLLLILFFLFFHEKEYSADDAFNVNLNIVTPENGITVSFFTINNRTPYPIILELDFVLLKQHKDGTWNSIPKPPPRPNEVQPAIHQPTKRLIEAREYNVFLSPIPSWETTPGIYRLTYRYWLAESAIRGNWGWQLGALFEPENPENIHTLIVEYEIISLEPLEVKIR